MNDDDSLEPRALSLRAMARGWVGPVELWEIARSTAEEGQTTGIARLRELLGQERFAHLSSAADSIATRGMSAPPPAHGVEEVWREIGGLGEARYEVGELLGRGGSGRIDSALDRETGRIIARKTLHQGATATVEAMAKFVREARIAAQLEHPGIVPLYDLGVLPDGQPYYTMRVVKRTSLRDVLSLPELRQHWPLSRLLAAMLQVCRALAYAHSRGVLHRDIKPENILLGDFGEVYLADWGIARVRRDSPLLFVHREQEDLRGAVAGTTGYIAPEELRLEPDVDHRADLFALGVVLYEILVGEHPFEAPTSVSMMLATHERIVTRPSEIAPGCPLVLEDLCLSLLEKDPNHRPESAEKVATEILAFLEGAKERERRREEAGELCRQAAEAVASHTSLEAERLRQGERAARLAKEIKDYEPAERKRLIWELEDRATRNHLRAERELARAIELYKQALAYNPEHEAAHLGLADLYWLRANAAAEERRPDSEVYYQALALQHDRGTYARLLEAPARLSVLSHPRGAEVFLHRYEERDRVLVRGAGRLLGETPLDVELEPGRYLVILKRPGFAEARHPVHLPRGAHHEAEVNLYTDDEIGEGFVYVPGGFVTLGGDPAANHPIPRQRVFVGDFAIATFPVTMREYCAFLDSLERVDPEIVRRRAPRDDATGGLVVNKGGDGRWQPSPVMIEGDARELFPYGEGHEWNIPAHLIDWFDARAYCRFRSEREGVPFYLPTEAEWEKAARGVDGRFFPWGDHFDPSFCLMRASRPHPPQPEPVGTFTTDESPYGVRDMAGGVREWVGDIFGDRAASELDAEPEPEPGRARGLSGWRQVRSGCWSADGVWARSASRGGQFAMVRGTGLGFRLAKALGRRKKND